jgi:diaminobutyrate-2-oxoglutarate transaminase
MAARITQTAWANGLMAERCGPHDEVVKLMPPLTISDTELQQGLTILEAAVLKVLTADQLAGGAVAGVA